MASTAISTPALASRAVNSPMREMATIPDHVPPSVLAELREARAAAKRLGVDVVRRVDGQWRAAKLSPTERRRRRLDALRAERTADQRLRLARAMVAHADNKATAARRRKLDALVAELNLGRRARRARLARVETQMIGGWR